MRSNFKSCFVVNFEYISHLCSSVSIVNFEHVIAGWERPSLINPQWIEAATRAEAYNSFKKRFWQKVFSCKFCEIFKNTFFTEHFRTSASAWIDLWPAAKILPYFAYIYYHDTSSEMIHNAQGALISQNHIHRNWYIDSVIVTLIRDFNY